MVEKRPALGRGLSALIPDAPAQPRRRPTARSRSTPISCGRTSFQPRTARRRRRIDDLARSIRANGIIQPIVVRKADDGYEIVAGERRWRAAQRAGLLKVPVVVRDIPDDRMLAAALIENIQREDLNPIEEAHAYRRLSDEFQLTQDQIADAVGKDRSSVANMCGCCACRTKCAKTWPPARSRWATRAPSSRCPTKPRSSASRATSSRSSCRCARPKCSSRKRCSPRHRAPSRRKTSTRAPPKIAPLRARHPRPHRSQGSAAGRIEIEFTTENELQRIYEQLTTELTGFTDKGRMKKLTDYSACAG